jgi:hypothetical protein
LLVSAALLASVTSGCIGGGSPHNVLLTVANERGEAATVSWASPGLLGTPLFPATGTETVQGCNVYRTGFGSGHNEVLIKMGEQTLDLAFDATSTDQLQRYVVIDPSGAISEVDELSMPTTGCGASS